MPDDIAAAPEDITSLLVVNPKGNDNAADTGAGDPPDNSDDDAHDSAVDPATQDDDEGGDAGDDDTGTDDDAADAAGDEGDDESSDETEPTATVKIDGKDVTVKLSELAQGYSRTQDYTRKTQELAENRKAIEAEQATVRAQRDQYAQVLETLAKQLGEKEPTAEEWAQLRASDPIKYAEEWAAHGQRKEALQQVKAEQDRIAGEKVAEQKAALKTYVDGERVKLMDAFPEWKDTTKFQAGAKAIFDYAKTVGFSEAELAQAYDHRMLVLADKARRFDELQARAAKATAKAAKADPLPAPGARQPQKGGKAVAHQAAMKKLDRTGAPEDAALAILN